MQAATLETLVNLVAAGYGATLIPALAADSLGQRGIVLLPLAGNSSRTIRLASRPGFPRPQALRALEKVIRIAVVPRLTQPRPSRALYYRVDGSRQRKEQYPSLKAAHIRIDSGVKTQLPGSGDLQRIPATVQKPAKTRSKTSISR